MTTITGTFTDASSNSMRGKVTFIPKAMVTEGGSIIVTEPIIAHLDLLGQISVALAPGSYSLKIEVFEPMKFGHEYWLLGGMSEEPFIYSEPATIPTYNMITVGDSDADLSTLMQF